WPKPVFLNDRGRLVLKNVPVPPLPPAPQRPAADPVTGTGPSALLGWIGDRMRAGAPATYDRLSPLGFWPRRRRPPADDELRVYEASRPQQLEDAWERTGLILAALARDVEGHGARFAVVYVPSSLEVSERAWALTRATYRVDDAAWNRGLVLER